jgi:hypothetical protein
MFKYVIGILTLQRLGLARPLRFFFLIVLGLLTFVVVINTANLFLTLSERIFSHHVQHYSSH